MQNIKIVVRNTHFEVTININSQRHKQMIKSFNNNLITYQSVYIPHLRKVTTSEDKRFYYEINKQVYHYSIHLLNTFVKRLLRVGFAKRNILIDRDCSYIPRVLKAVIRNGYTDREHQPQYIKKTLDTNPISLVDLKTGKGKTYISMRVCTELKYPTGIVVLSRYIEKWIGDVKELTTVKDNDIYVVQGKDSLAKLVDSGDDYDFVIFSLSTLRNYIKSYDMDPVAHSVSPEDLFARLGLGMMLVDEVHQSFHAGYMTMIRLNPLKALALSATLDNLDKGKVFMYATLYPNDVRCGNLVEFTPYPLVYAINYFIRDIDVVPSNGPRGYSHTLFEQAILRNSVFRNAYIKMLLHYTVAGYIRRKRTGDKLLILVQTIRMATLLAGYLSKMLPNVVVKRYVEEDPYENIITADITVSTNLSAGTALDIPKLITVLQTVSIGSLQANVQALGRLRELKDIDVRYYYTYSSNISSQQKLHIKRKEVTRCLAREYNAIEYDKIIG